MLKNKKRCVTGAHLHSKFSNFQEKRRIHQHDPIQQREMFPTGTKLSQIEHLQNFAQMTRLAGNF